jgi:hypothetical protein
MAGLISVLGDGPTLSTFSFLPLFFFFLLFFLFLAVFVVSLVLFIDGGFRCCLVEPRRAFLYALLLALTILPPLSCVTARVE